MNILFKIITLIAIAANLAAKVSAQNIDSTSLKAVLIIGSHEEVNENDITDMNEIACFLESRNFIVKTFYYDEAIWDSIKLESFDTDIFLYNGHGSRLGGKGKVGGLILDKNVTTKEIRDELHFTKSPLIIFKSVCNGAGSSASDDCDIGINEAKTRVLDYSTPFFEMGASAYYANNLKYGIIDFLQNLYGGQSIIDCYNLSAANAKIEFTEKHPNNNRLMISIASNNWEGYSTKTTYTNGVKKVRKIRSFKTYDIALVAKTL